MTGTIRISAEAGTAWQSFLRRRTAVFFTFGFPLILVAIFGTVVQTNPIGGGLFGHSTGFYVPGVLAIIVLFIPLSRIGGSIARFRDGNCFQKLATTPMSRSEWLAAHTLVNIGIILLASTIVLGMLELFAGGTITLSPLLLPFIVLGVVVSCGIGSLLGRIADSQDGVIAASNAVALPLVFLSEVIAPDYASNLVPTGYWPLTAHVLCSEGTNATYLQQSAWTELLVLIALAPCSSFWMPTPSHRTKRQL